MAKIGIIRRVEERFFLRDVGFSFYRWGFIDELMGKIEILMNEMWPCPTSRFLNDILQNIGVVTKVLPICSLIIRSTGMLLDQALPTATNYESLVINPG